ncbi:Cof-type HAD-IIB family hydrolase [Borrelia hermsii]|uniref:Hydrolase n=3 Tax=Borrelia hermsii TaxID=140 RepID=Q5RM07_BORHE|nr:Cof-type HAD-IIB family hydrolase [Borrelia hermsii]AAV66078.1 hydrolase [Borrelia hermsii]AAX16929.1 hydrolase (HAD superfamily) [Borrelia hermsii DAH]ABP49178.1 hydrolase [Borrelia hermsii]AJW73222.1 hydrolase [Borrelia hermsii CC1]AMR75423.1 Hydrolase (HAD superfamily) [Borrelia hermsii]
MNANYKKYKMLVFDLDGTLLNNDHEITPLTLKVLLKLKNDFHIIIATGRRFDEITDILVQLKEVQIDESYIVTANGAEVFFKNNLILRYKIDYDVVREILKVKRGDIDINLYTFNNWYSDREIRSPIMNYFIENLGIKPIITDLSKFEIDSCSKIVYYAQDLFKLEEFANKIREKNFKDISMFYSANDLLEITHIDASKYNAIKSIALFECIAIDAILAFGDNGNDYGMLKNVGKGIVMKNANDLVRNNLPNNEVTKFNNDEDGVAKFLIEFFNLDIDVK